jgi:hypothetical protein
MTTLERPAGVVGVRSTGFPRATAWWSSVPALRA